MGNSIFRTVYTPDYAAIAHLQRQQEEQNRRLQKMIRQQQENRLRLQREAKEKQQKLLRQIQQQILQQQEEATRQRQLEQFMFKIRIKAQKSKQDQIKKKNQELIRKNQQRAKQLKKPIIKTDPNQIKKIEVTKKKFEKRNKEIHQLLNPQKIKANEQKNIQIYLKHLETKKWKQDLSNQYGILHNIVAGDISAGKSSLLNYFLDLNQKVGVDQTTQGAKIVKKSGKICIWDSPGVNQDFDTFNIETLKLFATANKVFLIFQKSLKCCKNNVRILAACKNNINFYCIRTMCDKFQTEEQMKKSLQTDRNLLEKWGIKGILVMGISSKKQINFADNKKVKQLLLN